MRIEHGLFGYDDGHRLLASSMKLGDEALSQLTLLSDLAPGARFGSSDGYWTGFPLPQLKRYALMRTWPAPEMSRPGCVWTHALLLETSLFEEIDELSQLGLLTRRPRGFNDRAFYAEPIDPNTVTSALASHDAEFVQITRVTELLNSLYGGESLPIAVKEPGELDPEIFAIWSQQWPRLRRNFRFQTAASSEVGALRTRFDLRLHLLDAPGFRSTQLSATEAPAWLAAAAADSSGETRYELRQFLWRYGTDVKRQRGSFRPLCETFVMNQRVEQAPVRSAFRQSLCRWFPEKEDASRLKKDIVDGKLLAAWQLEFLSFLLKKDRGRTFPLPSLDGVGRLASLWPEKADEMLELAEYAISEDSGLALSITGIVLNVIPTANFWAVTKGFPRVRRRMIESRPNLLDAEEIADLDVASIAELIDAVPVDDPVGEALVKRLLHRADQDIARKVLRRFPTLAVGELISLANELGSPPLREWFNALVGEPTMALAPRTLALVRRTSTLYRLAEGLGWMSPDVLRAGTEPWLAGLAAADNDLPVDENDVLFSFFLALAIEAGGLGAQELFERCFSPIHERILKSYLPWKASHILIGRLPNLGWNRNWDNGLRLRLALTQTYIKYQLDPRSFASLSRDTKVRYLLRATANELEGGAPYASSISAS